MKTAEKTEVMYCVAEVNGSVKKPSTKDIIGGVFFSSTNENVAINASMQWLEIPQNSSKSCITFPLPMDVWKRVMIAGLEP